MYIFLGLWLAFLDKNSSDLAYSTATEMYWVLTSIKENWSEKFRKDINIQFNHIFHDIKAIK